MSFGPVPTALVLTPLCFHSGALVRDFAVDAWRISRSIHPLHLYSKHNELSLKERENPEDEVIRKRLLIDGDGAGDDRRINLLVKSFIKWCNSGSQEEGYSQYQRMLSTLSQCEFSMGKTLLVYDMNLREMENYEKIYKEIECSIAGAHEKIAECKKQILQAKRIRKNRQEYDALAKVIQHHPDRHETLKELEALGKELEHLSHIKESVEDKLELRRKQFHVLLSTIHELQQTLENDDKLSEVDEAQESTMEADPKP